MAKFLVRASYTKAGVEGLIKEGGSGRRAAVEGAVSAVGGSVESFYYAYGEDDALVIVEVPDSATAVGISLAVNASGAVTCTLTPLISVEELDEACKKSVGYRPPGS